MVAEFTGHTQALPDDFNKAEQMVQRLINNRLFAHGRPDHPQFLTSGVTIGVGLDDRYSGADSTNQSEVLRVTLKDPHIESIPSKVKDTALAVLAEVPVLKDAIAFESPEKHVAKLKDKLAEFIGMGADIDPKLLEWRGFDSDTAGTWHSAPDHALQISKNEFAVTVNIEAAKETKNIAENIRGRLPDIKQKLAERIAKYQGATDDAAKQAIAQQVEKMDVTLTFNETAKNDNYFSPGSISITFASPEQAEATKNKNVPGATPPDQLTLNKTNPLSSLTDEQLGKALGRSVLTAGETAKDVFPLIAGREDMKRAVTKKLKAFAKTHPEHEQCVQEFLKDDAFKQQHQWDAPKNQRVELKKPPVVNKDPSKPGEMTIDLTLSQGKAWEAVQAIAALDPQMQAKPAELGMAKVENIELVGVAGSDGAAKKRVQAHAQALIEAFRQTQAAMQSAFDGLSDAQASGAGASSAEQTANAILAKIGGNADAEQAIRPLAEKVIEGVVKANQAIANATTALPQEVILPITEANRALQDALNMGALGEWAQREKNRIATRANGQGLGAA